MSRNGILDLASLSRVARWTRNSLAILWLVIGCGLLFFSWPRVVLPEGPLRLGISVVGINGNLLSFFFRHRLQARFESPQLADYDILLKSRVGHYRADSGEPFLLPVYPRDQVVINIAGPTGGTVELRDGSLQRTFLPGGWVVLGLLGLAALVFHGLAVRDLTRQRCLKYLLAVSSAVLSFALLAVLVQFVDVRRNRQEPWQLFPPYLDKAIKIFPDITPGLPAGVVHFKTSSDGIRARERWTNNWDEAFSVLCLGASTTEDTFLGEESHWPRVLEKKLQGIKGTNVWVGNAGHNGFTPAKIAWAAGNYLPRTRPKYVVLYTGFDEGVVPGEKPAPAAPADRPMDLITRLGVLKEKVVLLRMARRVLFNQESLSPNDVNWGDSNLGVNTARQKFQLQAKQTPPRERTWENLDLSEFEKNLRQIHALTVQNGARLIVCTHPAIYRADLSRAEEQLLWLMGNYTVASKRKRMDVINDRTRRVAADLGVRLVDLDRELPRTTEAFYDDCHLNVRGAELVAEAVFQCFKTSAP